MPTYCLVFTGLCISAEAWAGWMQAFGTVVALGVAIWVPWRQQRLTIAREIERERVKADRLLGITAELVGRCMQFAQQVLSLRGDALNKESDKQRKQQESAVLELETALRSIPLHQLHNATCAMQVIQALGALSEARRWLPWRPRHISDRIICGDDYAAPWIPIAGSLVQAHAVLTNELAALA
jgi:hypothetical protein